MRVDRHSVRWRVTAGASTVLVLALLIATLAAAGLLRRALTSDEEAVLNDRLNEVEALITDGLLTRVLEPTGQEVGQVQVVDAAGEVVAVTPGLAATIRLDVVAAPAVGKQIAVTVDGESIGGKAGDEYRVVARTVPSQVGPLTIYAVTTLAAAQRAERYLRNVMLIGLPVVVVLAALFIFRVVGRALAPVDAMREEVDRIEATDLTGRVATISSEDEVARLGSTLNRLLDRLQAEAGRQALFAASASHELRSPVSAIRTELEVGLAYPDRAEWPQIAQDSLIELDRLEVLARDLRTLTRSRAATPAVAERFDLWGLVSEELSHRRPVEGIRYRSSGQPALVEADREGVLRVVRNLFDNAERHAGSEIRVGVSPDPDGVALVVANDGDPIPVGARDQIFDPFTRLDEARSLDAGGSGLGLAIARTVMQANGGTLVAAAVEHGAEFRAWFPPVPPAT